MRIFNLVTSLLVATLALPAAALPTADAVLDLLGFSGDAKQQVLAGQFVTAKVKPSSDRELATSLAFLVNKPPRELIADVKQGLAITVDPNTLVNRHRIQADHGSGHAFNATDG